MLVYCLFICMIFAILLVDHWRIVALEHHNSLPKQKPSTAGVSIVCFIACLFSAVRFGIGWDYAAYYDTIQYNAVTNIVSGQEYATIFLIELAKNLEMVNLYFAVNACLCMLLLYIAIRRFSVDPSLSIMLFICFPLFFLNSFSVIRFFTALIITFYAFQFIVHKQWLKYVVAVLIASLFHQSALIALTFYFVRFIRMKTTTIAVLLALLPVFASIGNMVVVQFVPQYAVYTEATTVQEGTKAILFFIVIAIMMLVVRKYITQDDEVAALYCNLFLVGIAIYLMFYEQGTMGHRLSLYGTIYVLYVVPKLFTLCKDALPRALYKFLFYVLLAAIFLYTVYTGAATYVPYKTIFH